MKISLLGKCHSIGDYFASFSIDLSQILGKDWWSPSLRKSMTLTGKHKPGPFDFSRARLHHLTRPLAPAFLRIGGNKADQVFYAMHGEDMPKRFKDTVPKERWDEIVRFAEDNDLRLFLNINAGKGTRDKKGRWNGENLHSLLSYAKKNGTDIAGFEFGNEPNAYVFHRMKASGKRYAKNYARCREIVKHYYPDAVLTGGACAFWPYLGEGIPVTRGFLKYHDGPLDAVSWHFYPQQSGRAPIATRRAGKKTFLRLKTLNAVGGWHRRIDKYKRRYAHDAEFWMTETGGAQCGGQRGITDAFIGSFWWLDHLGTLARLGYKTVIRQTLAGADYGLLTDDLDPNPDYWATLLWKQFMNGDVHLTDHENKTSTLRIYVHASEEYTTLLAINIGKRGRHIELDNDAILYEVGSDHLYSRNIYINGKKMVLSPDGSFPEIDGRAISGSVYVKPRTYCFVRIKK